MQAILLWGGLSNGNATEGIKSGNMSYKRTKIIRVLREHGFEFLREGGNHTIFTNGTINIPVGRHREIDRDMARIIAKEIGIEWLEFKEKIN